MIKSPEVVMLFHAVNNFFRTCTKKAKVNIIVEIINGRK